MNLLQEAESLINGQRRKDYGGVSESFAVISGLWSAYLDREITPHDVCNMMVLMKVSRARNGFHRDSYVDIAGYAALTEKLDEEAEAKDPDPLVKLKSAEKARTYQDMVAERTDLEPKLAYSLADLQKMQVVNRAPYHGARV